MLSEEYCVSGNKTTNDMDIIYEDNHIISVVKPINILSQEDSTGDFDMVNLLKADLKIRYEKPGNVFVGLIHRLDRPVGGTMVFSKTSKGASRLSEQMRNGEFGKGYYAVVKGILPNETGLLSNVLIKDELKNLVREAVTQSEINEGKASSLQYFVLDSKEGLSLVFVIPITGRSHQIRVQMALAGVPLVGDIKYGKATLPSDIALWSSVVMVKHPTMDKHLVFRSYPPLKYPWSLWSDKIFAKSTQINVIERKKVPSNG